MGKGNVFNYVHNSSEKQNSRDSEMKLARWQLVSHSCWAQHAGWGKWVDHKQWNYRLPLWLVKGLKAQKQLGNSFLRTAAVLSWGDGRGEIVWRHVKQTCQPSWGHVRTRTSTSCARDHTETDIFNVIRMSKYFLSPCESKLLHERVKSLLQKTLFCYQYVVPFGQ